MENLAQLKKKKFLIIGSDHYLSLENCYIRSFNELGIKNLTFFSLDQVFFFKFFNKFKIFHFIYKNIYKILIIFFFLIKNKYDFIFIFKGLELNLNILKVINNLNNNKKSVWVNIFTDNPFNVRVSSCSNRDVLDSVKFYDFFCVSFKKNLNKRLRKIKAKKIIFLPFGYDRKLHKHKFLKLKNKKNSINFIGSYDPHRLKIILSLKKYNIDIFGNGWPKKILKKNKINYYPVVTGNNLHKILNKYTISLNILRLQDTSSHNMKTFEIPSMGGLLLTNTSKEQEIFFKNNRECIMYNGVKNLKEKIDFIFNNSKSAEKIRYYGFKRSKEYTYTKRLIKLLGEINV